MADISSNSLDNNSLFEDLAKDIVKDREQKPPLDLFAEEYEREQVAKVNAAARWTRKFDPDQYKKAEALGMGIDPERGIRQMELLENNAAIMAYGDVFSRAPAMKGYFAEQPKALAKTKPDELDNLSGLEWLGSATSEAFTEGQTSIRAAEAANRLEDARKTGAKPSIYDQAFVENYQGGRTFGADSWVQKGLIGGVSSFPLMWDTIKGSMRGSVLGGGGGAVVGSAVPVLGTAAGAVTGATSGFLAGGYMRSADIQTGLARLEFNKWRSKDGQKLDPKVADIAARVSGSLSAALDLVGIGAVTKAVPGASTLISGLSKDGIKTALEIPAMRKAMLDFVENTSEGVATETATEMLQQAIQVYSGELAKANSQGEWEMKSSDERMAEIADAGIQALQVMTLLGPFMASTRFGADLVEINRSKRGQDNLNQALAHVAENELITRDPQLAADLIDRQVGDQKLYIPSEEIVQLYQEQGLDRYGPALPNWRERLDAALATGGDVEVTVGEFVAHLSKDPKDNPLLDLVRTDPTGYTRAEIQAYSDALDEVMLSEVQKAQKKGALPGQRLDVSLDQTFPELEGLKQQIKDIGFEQKAVESYTTMFGAFFNTLSQRTGKSPSELFSEFGVEVQRGLLSEMDAGSQEAIMTDKLGLIKIAPEGEKSTIQLFDGHDMSTLLHESGHFFLNVMKQVKSVAPDIAADWITIQKHTGIEGDVITREQHEAFAKMAEAYFMSGKAPDPKLRPMFEQFRRWLKSIYQSIRKLGGSVDPEIAKVFDRMFATDARIEEIALDTAYAPIFDAAESMGLSPEEFLAYSNLVDDLKREATDTSRERIAGQTERLAKGWRGEIQKQLRLEAETELRKTAPYVHVAELKRGQIKIDRGQLLARGNEELVKKFPRESLAKDGLDLDLVAEMLNYPSSDDMLYDFAQMKPIKEAAKELAEAEMAKRYGEAFENGEVMDLAIKEQMAQDARLTILGTELKALSRKAGKEITDFGPKQLARELARQSIYRTKVGDLSSFRAQAAVTRSASMAQAAIVKGDWVKAADWKRKQLIAQAVMNETAKVEKVVKRIRDKAARYSRTAGPSIHPSYMEQIRALVEKYSFAKVSGKKLAKIVSLRQFLEEAINDGEVTIEIPDRLLREADRVNYKELTAEDLLGLGDTLDNLEHLGRVKQKLRKAKELREFEEVKKEILQSIRLRPARAKKMKTYTEEQRRLVDKGSAWFTTLLKPEQIIDFLDSGNIKGPLMEHIFQPITDALNAQNELSVEYNKKIMDIFQEIPSNYLTEIVSVEGFPNKFTREEIYAAALNTGNASSRKKLIEGEMWSEEQLTNVLAHMTKEDWDRVQSVWKVLDGLWPKISALEKRLTGVAPPQVEARAFSTPFGEYEGGYYPIVYDFKTRRGKALIEDVTPVDKRFANGLFSNDFVRPGTNHKYTTKRTKTAKPINLSLGVLPGHVQTVIHDLTHREAIRSAYKLLWDPEVQRAIEDVEGHDAYRNLQEWLKNVATERHTDMDETSKIVQHIRTGMTVYGLGYRVTTMMAQGLGLFPSLTKVSKSGLAEGIYRMTKNPISTWNFVNSMSLEMKHRMNQQDRDIKAAVRDLTRKKGVKDWFLLHAFTMIGAIDGFVSRATWIGAYSDAIKRDPTDAAGALAHADRTVRLTQGTGNVKDMAQIMNSKSELNRIFTMFYSGFSAQYNLQVGLTRKTIGDIKAGDWQTVALEDLPRWIYLVPLPAILGAWITGDAPEEDESLGWWMGRKALLYPIAAVPFAREVAGSIDTGFGYNMSPISRVGGSTVKSLQELLKFTDEDKEFDLRRFTKSTAEVGSILLKLPTGQIISTTDNLWKGLEQGDLQPRDLIYRRKN